MEGSLNGRRKPPPSGIENEGAIFNHAHSKYSPGNLPRRIEKKVGERGGWVGPGGGGGASEWEELVLVGVLTGIAYACGKWKCLVHRRWLRLGGHPSWG